MLQSTMIPPMREGVSASTVFLPKDSPHQTIFEFLLRQFPHIQEHEWKQRFDDGLVINQHGESIDMLSPYVGDQHIHYYRHLAHEAAVPFAHQIIFENEHLIVVDKPHFLTVSPTGQYVQQTLLTRLKKATSNPLLSPIHRLDRETAGLILFSKQVESRHLYQQLFVNKEIHKTYHAIAPFLCHLNFPFRFSARMQKGEPFYRMKIVEGESNSVTDIALLEHNQNWAKYQLKPITGKQHQLRVHMNALGMPLKNDRLYPEVQHLAMDDFSNPLQLLAKEIDFIDPLTGQHFNFYSSFDLLLPEQLTATSI